MKSFLNISDFTKSDIFKISSDDTQLVNDLKGKNIGMIFEKYSTRTRLSFAVGISSLGGNAIDIKFEELNISRDESFEDTFRAMNCYLDGLIYRTDDHQKLVKAKEFFKKPIVNALSDKSHPCQIISDLFTIKEQFGSLNCNLLWVGDMNNVCFSLVEAANLIDDIKLTIWTPKFISNNKDWFLSSNVSVVNILEDVDLKSVNCVMTDVFISMNDEDNDDKLAQLKPYIVTSELMSKMASNCVFMHCLPAKVGFEVSEEVFLSPKSIVWKQAYNRMIAQKKLMQLIY